MKETSIDKAQAKTEEGASRKKPGAAEKKQAVPGCLRGWGPLTRPPFKGDTE